MKAKFDTSYFRIFGNLAMPLSLLDSSLLMNMTFGLSVWMDSDTPSELLVFST